MNYIPGFSNYLETTVPDYGPAPIMEAEPVVPQRAMVEPTTQEAVAPAANGPLTLAQLAARVAPGRDPSQREQIIASQNLVSTPYSINNYLEFGNGQGVAGGTPATTGLYAGHNYTLVDNKTGTILAQGSTPEEIQKIQDIANNLSSAEGKNADWRLYDANPESGITNMHEKMPGAYLDLSTPGDPRGVVVAGNMPNNIFKDFIIPALTPLALAAGAYFGGGALLGQAAGGGAGAAGAGLGATTGGAAATGAGAGLGTAATGAGLGAAASGVAPIVVTGGVAGGLTAAQTAALAAGLASLPAVAPALGGTGAGVGGSASAATPYEPIVVTGGGTTTGLGALPAVAGGITSSLPALTELAMDPSLAQPATEDIVVTGNKAIPKTVVPDVLEAVGPILPQLGIPQVPTPDPALTNPKNPLGIEDYLSIAGKIVPLLGAGGGKDGSDQTGTYGGAGNGRLNPIFSAKLPSAGGLGTIGANRTVRPMGEQDWLTYGQRPELNFFDYAAQNNPAPVTTPVPGNPAGPIMAEDKVRHSEEGIPLWMQLGLPNPNAPATQPATAGSIMTAEETPRMAEGGAFAAKRGGRSQRTEFAVNGPGTGRSDDIPAVLSDGEYVIDAETVALLGDGSSKAGAKKLDDLRVKVRKHKGKKLAKGRFSANAKKPEAYLSGGRI